MSIKTNIIIQARMGSTRLTGKVLKTVMDRPMLSYQLERVKRIKSPAKIIVATTKESTDDQIVEFCKEHKIDCFRGSVENVLDRFYQCCQEFPCDIIVRLTADCPLIDPQIIDDLLNVYKENSFDYVSNTLERTFPRGMDVEIFSYAALQRAKIHANSLVEKEHVTPYFYNNPAIFSLKNVKYFSDESSYRLTVDTSDDFHLIEKIFKILYPKNPLFTLEDILKTLRENKELPLINQHIRQKVD